VAIVLILPCLIPVSIGVNENINSSDFKSLFANIRSKSCSNRKISLDLQDGNFTACSDFYRRMNIRANWGFGESLNNGIKTGISGAISGGLIGGVAGGISAYHKGNNVWTGDQVTIGRNRFSFDNSLPNDLFILDPSGESTPIRYSHFYDKKAREIINTRFYPDNQNDLVNGTYNRFTSSLDLKYTNEAPSTTQYKLSRTLSHRIRGYVGVERSLGYFPEKGGVIFASERGFLNIKNPWNGFITMPLKNASFLDVSLYGLPQAESTAGYFKFRIVARLKY